MIVFIGNVSIYGDKIALWPLNRTANIFLIHKLYIKSNALDDAMHIL